MGKQKLPSDLFGFAKRPGSPLAWAEHYLIWPIYRRYRRWRDRDYWKGFEAGTVYGKHIGYRRNREPAKTPQD